MKMFFSIVAFLFITFCTVGKCAAQDQIEPTPDSLIVRFKPVEVLEVPITEIENHLQEHVTICGLVTSVKVLKEKGRPIVMHLQGDDEKAKAEVRFRFKDVSNFSKRPDKLFKRKKLCFSGTVVKNEAFTEFVIDTAAQQNLLMTAAALPASLARPVAMVKQPLQTNAYLFAGPSLDEITITHLKQGSVVIPYYFKGPWAYVMVVQKAQSNDQSASLNGFIRKSSLDLKGKTKNPGLE